MICLGIESTAHTFGVAIMDDSGRVYANEKDNFTTESGGMIPFKVAEHHVNCCDIVFQKAMEKANIPLSKIDLISFSDSPGIGHTLRIGAMFARSLAILLNKPLVGVNHCIAHLEIGTLTGAKDPVLLYASGANTQVIAYEAGKYRIFGETLDNGVGNFIDSFARELGLGFPGGPKVYELSLKSEMAKKGTLVKLPYSVKGMDVSFGGMFTLLKMRIKELEKAKDDEKKLKELGYTKEDLCFSVQETVFAMLVEVSERAMAHCDKKELLLGGGVACNKRLQEMCRIMCEERDAKLFVPENQFLVDNAAMIAWLGMLKYKSEGQTKIEDAIIKPYERTDEVKVSWR